MLSSQPDEEEKIFSGWIREKTKTEVGLVRTKLKRPTDYEGIYLDAEKLLKSYDSDRDGRKIQKFYNLTSGTPTMAGIWLLLAKSKCPGELIEMSREEGVRIVSVPLDIYAEHLLSLKEK